MRQICVVSGRIEPIRVDDSHSGEHLLIRFFARGRIKNVWVCSRAGYSRSPSGSRRLDS